MSMRKMWKDRRGLTLIELVIAVAILGIISTTVGGALVVATNAYRNGTEETALQSEAQFTINAIEALLIDATDTVEFDGSVLKIENVDYTYEIVFDPAGRTLHYTQYETGNPANEIAKNELLAEHVKEFIVDTSQFAVARTVKITITMVNSRNQDYTTVYNITSRNNPDAGVVIVETPFIIAESEVVLEPNQNYHLSVVVDGAADTGFTIVPESGSDPTTSINATPTGLDIHIGPSETGAGGGTDPIKVMLKSNAVGADGAPAERLVKIYIRRVNSISFSYTWSGTELRAGTVYSVSALAAGQQMDQWDPVIYPCDADYVNTYTAEFLRFEVVGGTGNGNDYAELVSGAGNKDFTFRLKRDLEDGVILRVYARSLHSYGLNKSTMWYADVEDFMELHGVSTSTPPFELVDDSELRRNTETQVKINLDYEQLIEEEWKREHPGQSLPSDHMWDGNFTGRIYYRWKSDDETDKSQDYPKWHRISQQGSDMFKFNAGDFANMKYFMKDYEIELLFSFAYDNGRKLYPASAYAPGTDIFNGDPKPEFNDPDYIYIFPLKAFSMVFDEYKDGKGYAAAFSSSQQTAGGTGLGTLANPVKFGNGEIMLSFTLMAGASADRHPQGELCNHTKSYRYVNGTWEQVSIQLENKGFDPVNSRTDGTLSFWPRNLEVKDSSGNPIVYKMVLEGFNNGELYANVNDNGINGQHTGVGGRGIIYFTLEN